MNLHIDPVSGWARTTTGELLPPSTLAAIAKTLPGRRGSLPLLHAHHVPYWRHGGPTNLANDVPFCGPMSAPVWASPA